MKLGRLNHVGVATPSIEQSVALYRDVMGATGGGRSVRLAGAGGAGVFCRCAQQQIELIEPLGADSPIVKFLEKNPLGGQHHLCFEVRGHRGGAGLVRGQGRAHSRADADRGAWDADLLPPPQGHGRGADRDHGKPEAGALMAQHDATIAWSDDDPEGFAKGTYSRAHEWRFDGGRGRPGLGEPERGAAPWSDPAAVDPEEAFVASLSAATCCGSSIWRGGRGMCCGYEDEAQGALEKCADGKLRMTRVTLAPADRVRRRRLTRPRSTRFTTRRTKPASSPIRPPRPSVIGRADHWQSPACALGPLAMTDTDTKPDLESPRREGVAGPDLSARDARGDPAEDRLWPRGRRAYRQRLSRRRALHARALCDDVCRAAVDDPAICGLLDRRGIQRFLSPQPRRGAEGAERRVRSRDASRL